MTAAARTAGAPAGLGRRLLSLIYEALLLVAVLFAASALYVAWLAVVHAEPHRVVLQVYLALITGVYFTWQWVRGGQTLPMKTWRIGLVSRSGQPLTWKQAAFRYGLALAGTAALGVTYWWAFIDGERRFLHDRVADTMIVYR